MADDEFDPNNVEKVKIGPPLYENWRAFEMLYPQKKPSKGYECELFSDVRFSGEIINEHLGPYQILNPTPTHTYLPDVGIETDKVHSALVLRYVEMGTTLNRDPVNVQHDDSGNYHGGTLVDEMAALLSLLFGVRIQAGRLSREFPTEDLLGRPFFLYDKPEPALPINVYYGIVPSLRKHCVFQPIEGAIFSFPRLDPVDAVALTKAARLYQNAIWIAEADPNLAWLWLVSAVEVAANRNKVDVVEALKDYKPNLVKLLEEKAVQNLIPDIAQELVNITGSTKKFVNFLLEHYPRNPLPDRPLIGAAQIEWTEKNFKTAFGKIYQHRSNALHTGRPFPYPMCSLPLNLGSDGRIEEKPMGMVRGAKGTVWTGGDLPLHLYVFEYIVREALKNWWTQVTPSDSNSKK